jgi:hypothetical protein
MTTEDQEAVWWLPQARIDDAVASGYSSEEIG